MRLGFVIVYWAVDNRSKTLQKRGLWWANFATVAADTHANRHACYACLHPFAHVCTRFSFFIFPCLASYRTWALNSDRMFCRLQILFSAWWCELVKNNVCPHTVRIMEMTMQKKTAFDVVLRFENLWVGSNGTAWCAAHTICLWALHHVPMRHVDAFVMFLFFFNLIKKAINSEVNDRWKYGLECSSGYDECCGDRIKKR